MVIRPTALLSLMSSTDHALGFRFRFYGLRFRVKVQELGSRVWGIVERYKV